MDAMWIHDIANADCYVSVSIQRANHGPKEMVIASTEHVQ